MLKYSNFILDFLGYLYDALHKQCLVEKIVISESYIRQKSKFSNFQGYETHHPSLGNFFQLFSFKDLVSRLYSTTVIFFYLSVCKV